MSHKAGGIERLFFMHIPKCGGTSLLRYLEDQYAENRRFVRNGWPKATAAEISNLDRYDLIGGHFDARILPFLPEGMSKIVCLRDPISRTISALEHSKRLANFCHPLVQKELSELSVAEIASKHGFMHFYGNQITAYLGAYIPAQISRHVSFEDEAAFKEYFSFDEVPHSMQRAFKNLCSFDDVFFVENLDDAVCILSDRYGMFPAGIAPKLNVAPAKVAYHPQVYKMIASWNRDDMELYSLAKAYFKNRKPPTKWELQRKYFLGKPSIQEAGAVSLEAPLTGWGWHEEEFDNGQCSRWSGPGTVSSLSFKVEEGSNYLCTARMIIGFERYATRVRITVRGVQLANHVQSTPGAVTVPFAINKELIQSGIVEVVFLVDKVGRDENSPRAIGFKLLQVQVTRDGLPGGKPEVALPSSAFPATKPDSPLEGAPEGSPFGSEAAVAVPSESLKNASTDEPVGARESDSSGAVDQETGATRVQKGFCAAPWTEALLRPNGKLLTCCRSGVVMGNWKELGMEAAWGSDAFAAFRRKIADGIMPDSSCRNCVANGTVRMLHDDLLGPVGRILSALKALDPMFSSRFQSLADLAQKPMHDAAAIAQTAKMLEDIADSRRDASAEAAPLLGKLEVLCGIIHGYLCADVRPRIAGPCRQVSLQQKCNARCIQCPGRYTGEIEHGEGLEPEYVDKAFASPEHIISFFMNGSEFLLYHDWKRIAKLLVDNNAPFSLSTNGILLTKQNIRHIIDNKIVSALNVSMDGATKGTLESIRVNVDYDRLVDNIRYLFKYASQVGYDFSLTFSFVLMERNHAEFPALVRLISDLRSEHPLPSMVRVFCQGLESYSIPGYVELLEREHHSRVGRERLVAVFEEAATASEQTGMPVSVFYRYEIGQFLKEGCPFPPFPIMQGAKGKPQTASADI